MDISFINWWLLGVFFFHPLAAVASRFSCFYALDHHTSSIGDFVSDFAILQKFQHFLCESLTLIWRHPDLIGVPKHDLRSAAIGQDLVTVH